MIRSLVLLHILAFCLVLVNAGSTRDQTDGAAVNSNSDVLFKLVQEFEDFKKLLNTIDARLKTVQASLEQRVTPDDSKCAIRDITEAIRTHKFKQAEEKLVELGDNKKLPNIIHDVYAGSPANVDIIVSFAKKLSQGEAQFLVFSALRDEMRSSGHNDPFKLITVVQALEREASRKKNEDVRERAQMVIDNTIEDVKVSAASIFKAAMLTDKYQKNVEIESLASAIFDFRSEVSNDVMDRVVDSVFGVVAAGRILDNISSHKHIPQVVTGLTAVFNRFNYAGNLNNDATINLASHLHQLQLREKYSSLSQDLKDDVEKIIQQLPACARNLFFNTHVCFWNKARGQYMYAASTSISHDAERRSIYTWYPGDIKTGAYWHVQRIGDDFYFKNRDHADEYLYAAAVDYNKDMRYIFTWIPGNNTDGQSAWSIELDGDYCYVKTTYFNEYLFAPAVKYDELNSYVFTWKPGTSVRSAEFQWQIKNCGQAEVKHVATR